MLTFLQSHWDKLLVAAIAIYGAVLSTYTYRQNKARDAREQRKTAEADRAELERILAETMELKPRVEFLDEWIWKARVFTRKQQILDALDAIREYWKRNGSALRKHLGEEARTYRGMAGLFDVALQNRDNQPPPTGVGEWRGITQENLLGFQVEQLFYHVIAELKVKCDTARS